MSSTMTTTTPTTAPPGPQEFTVVRPRRPWRWVTLAVLGVLAAQLVHGAATNDRLSWGVVADYFLDPRILNGLRTTIWLTVVSMALATVIGVALAVMALSRDPVLRLVARLYVSVFRSVPPIVQLLFWYYLAAVLPTVGLGVPFGPEFVTFDTNLLIGQFAAALLGLSLGEAAFLAEYIRGGILAVPRGQLDAAAACGLTPAKTFRRIVLPQAIRIIIPAYGNSVISQVKATAVVFVIGAGDLMTRAQLIYSQNFEQVPLLIVVTTWYLILVVALTVVQRRLEARYSRGYGESRQDGPRIRPGRLVWSRRGRQEGTA